MVANREMQLPVDVPRTFAALRQIPIVICDSSPRAPPESKKTQIPMVLFDSGGVRGFGNARLFSADTMRILK